MLATGAIRARRHKSYRTKALRAEEYVRTAKKRLKNSDYYPATNAQRPTQPGIRPFFTQKSPLRKARSKRSLRKHAFYERRVDSAFDKGRVVEDFLVDRLGGEDAINAEFG